MKEALQLRLDAQSHSLYGVVVDAIHSTSPWRGSRAHTRPLQLTAPNRLPSRHERRLCRERSRRRAARGAHNHVLAEPAAVGVPHQGGAADGGTFAIERRIVGRGWGALWRAELGSLARERCPSFWAGAVELTFFASLRRPHTSFFPPRCSVPVPSPFPFRLLAVLRGAGALGDAARRDRTHSPPDGEPGELCPVLVQQAGVCVHVRPRRLTARIVYDCVQKKVLCSSKNRHGTWGPSVTS